MAAPLILLADGAAFSIPAAVELLGYRFLASALRTAGYALAGSAVAGGTYLLTRIGGNKAVNFVRLPNVTVHHGSPAPPEHFRPPPMTKEHIRLQQDEVNRQFQSKMKRARIETRSDVNKKAAVAKLRATKAANPARYASMYAPAQFGGPRPPIELKCVDTAISTAIVNDPTSTAIPLNLMGTGSGFFNRIGRRVYLQSLYMNGCVTLNTTNPIATIRYVRVAIVYDKANNGTRPTWQDVFQSVDQSGAFNRTSLAHLNLNNRERFRVISDQRIQLGCSAASNGNAVMTPNNTLVQTYRRLNGLEMTYNADAATSGYADCNSGILWLMLQSDGNPLATYSEQFAGVCRIRYTD